MQQEGEFPGKIGRVFLNKRIRWRRNRMMLITLRGFTRENSCGPHSSANADPLPSPLLAKLNGSPETLPQPNPSFAS